VVGFLIVAIGMAWGTDAGYAINPARDFGPRLASFFTGFHHAFQDQYGNLYFWIPIVGPIVGGILGAGLYELLVGRFLPKAGPQEPGELPATPDKFETTA
jgi:glycerol uptake facilitator protein